MFIVINALNKCRENNNTRINLLLEIRKLQAQSNTKLIITSRFIAEIEQEFKEDINLEIRARNKNIKRYLNDYISRLSRIIFEKPSLPLLIKTNIIITINRM